MTCVRRMLRSGTSAMVREGMWHVCRCREIDRMNGTVPPLRGILSTMNEVIPYGQSTVVVAGAHKGFIWAWRTRDGYLLGLEDRDRVPGLASAHEVAHIHL